MKAKVFEKLIRKIVREEIDYALRREIKSLKEDLNQKQKQQLLKQVMMPPLLLLKLIIIQKLFVVKIHFI